MASYTLSGTGTQALSTNVTAAHVTINTPGSLSGIGRANPLSRYDVALLRFGDGTGFWAPVAVNGGPQWIGVPAGTTEVGYSVFGAASLTFAEVIGGSPPFGTSTPSLEQLTDVSVSGVSNGQVLEWDSASSLWKNQTLATGGTPTLGNVTKVQLDYVASTDLANGTSLSSGFTWTDLSANQSFTVDLNTSTLWISVGGCVLLAGSANDNIATRIVIDSAGTPQNVIIGRQQQLSASGWTNALAASQRVPITGLSAASHTVKVQVASRLGGSFYCLASSSPESYGLRIIVEEVKA